MSKSLTNVNALEKIKVYLNMSGEIIDISAMATTIHINETIKGDLTGRIEITDDSGLIDELILTGDEVINISYKYFDVNIDVPFFLNGISNINMMQQTHAKTYAFELGSINDYISATNLIARSFEGTSVQIMYNIYISFFSHSNIAIGCDGKNVGRYIAPNISPKKAILNILNKSYDINNSPLLMFQTLSASGATFINSLHNLLKENPVFTMTPTIISSTDIMKTGPIKANIGRPTNIIINDTVDIIGKSANGDKGKNIYTLYLNSSDNSEVMFRGSSRPAITEVRPLRLNMYDDDVRPILTLADPTVVAQGEYDKAIWSSISAVAYNCPAVVGLSVGDMVNLEIDERRQIRKNMPKKISSKYGYLWLVTKINHRISQGLYTQDISLSKGYV
jgi:hypothetical protein